MEIPDLKDPRVTKGMLGIQDRKDRPDLKAQLAELAS